MAEAYAAYSHLIEAVVPERQWDRLLRALAALKGHVQEYLGCQTFDVFASSSAGPEGRLLVCTTWDTVEQLQAFVEHGYTFEALCAEMQPPIRIVRDEYARKIY